METMFEAGTNSMASGHALQRTQRMHPLNCNFLSYHVVYRRVSKGNQRGGPVELVGLGMQMSLMRNILESCREDGA